MHETTVEHATRQATAKDLWERLGDTPIDNEECIEEPFLHFEAGTWREEIWHWFEDHFNVSVVDLMGLREIYDE